MKKHFMKTILGTSLALSLLALESGAKSKTEAKKPAAVEVDCKNNGTDLVFPKARPFQILSYDAKTDTYEINSPELPGEGESYITLDGLIRAVPKLKRRRLELRKNPEDIIDSVFSGEKDLPTLLDTEREARKACVKAPIQ